MKQDLFSIQRDIKDAKASKMKQYRELVIGESSWRSLIVYEAVTLSTSWLPGGLGLFLRSKAYPLIIKKVGKNVFWGRNVVLRSPNKIKIGDNVIIDDNCVLDARGEGNSGISIGNNVILSRNVILGCKGGEIQIGNNVGIGSNSIIHSLTASPVEVGDNCRFAAYCYLIGGSEYKFDRVDIPIAEQGVISKGGIKVDANVWLGAGVTVVDGVKIERDVIVGAGAVVLKNLPPFAIATGVPAQIVKVRK